MHDFVGKSIALKAGKFIGEPHIQNLKLLVMDFLLMAVYQLELILLKTKKTVIPLLSQECYIISSNKLITDVLKFMTADLAKIKTDPKWGCQK